MPNLFARSVFVQGHRHSEPVCAWPECSTYLTPAQMATLAEAQFDAARQQIIKTAMPRLMARRADLLDRGFEVVGVMLPTSMDPGTYDGPGATDIHATIMGVPVVWGEAFSVLVGA